MKNKIECIIRCLLIIMTIVTVISVKFIVKQGVNTKLFMYYMFFYLALLFLFFIYQVASAIINATRVSKATRSLKWIGFKKIIFDFFKSLIVLFIIMIAFKYIFKHNVNIMESLWSCVGIAISTTGGELIYKFKNQEVKLS